MPSETPRTRLWRGAGARLLLFSFIWAVLTEGERSSWGIGLVTVVLATGAALALPSTSPWRWRLGGALRFLPYFLFHSLRGSIDVSRRALHPRLPLDPAFVPYRVRLPAGGARIFLANTVNLLPGTLSVGLDGDLLTVHMLDGQSSHRRELAELEERVADLFGVGPLPAEEE